MKLLSYLCALLSLGFIGSCGTDDPDDGKPKYTTLQLALQGGDSKFWVLSQEKYNGVDITASYKPCELDNVTIYDVHKNFTIDAGPTKCADNPEPDEKRGYYELDEVNMTLLMGSADTTYTVNILTLESKILKWEIEVDGEMIEKTFIPK